MSFNLFSRVMTETLCKQCKTFTKIVKYNTNIYFIMFYILGWFYGYFMSNLLHFQVKMYTQAYSILFSCVNFYHMRVKYDDVNVTSNIFFFIFWDHFNGYFMLNFVYFLIESIQIQDYILTLDRVSENIMLLNPLFSSERWTFWRLSIQDLRTKEKNKSNNYAFKS